MTAATHSWPGTDRFEVKRQLGAGGMGVVYEAYDRELEAFIAIKTLRGNDARSRSRFEREFQALAELEHPSLVSLGELIVDSDPWFFTMELIEGDDFVSYVRQQKLSAARRDNQACSFNEPRLRASLRQLAQGIAAIHEAGKLHRDIKPSNILVTAAGRVVVLDFGLVTQVALDRQSSGASVVGTASYVAPEQALADGVGPPADWYGFGVVLYEALTGHLPHTGLTDFELMRKKQQRSPAPPRQRVPEVPADLDELCVDLLRIAPERRPSAREILERLGVDDAGLPALPVEVAPPTFTQATPFVGRQSELSLLGQAFEESRRGRSVSVFIHGESGLGKSELVGEFTRTLRAAAHRPLVLSGRCHERQAVPYEAFAGIADSLSRHLAALPDAEVERLLPRRAGLLPELFSVLSRVKPIAAARIEPRAGLAPQEHRSRLFGAFRELLARVALGGQLVVVVEDMHWIGPDSLTMLGELLHSAEAPEMLLVGTARPGVEDRLARQVSGDVRHIVLEELSPEHAHELTTRLAPGLDSEQAAAVAESAGGHPLFILELVRYLSGGGTIGEMSLDEALWSRISELDTPHRKLLEVLAVAGAPIARETAAAAAGLTRAEFERVMRSLRVACLARTGGRDAATIEPYHDRIRSAVLGNMDSSGRRQCHRELAITVEQSGLATTDPQILVRHFAAAGDSLRAAKHAETAAVRAYAMSAFDQAAELYRTSLELGDHETDKRLRLLRSLGQALVAAGRGVEAADAFLEVAAGADASTRFDCHRQAAEQLLINGHLERGLETMNSLLTEVGVQMPTSPKRALFSLLWQRAKLRVRGLRWKEKPVAKISPEVLVLFDVYEAASHGLGIIDIVRGMDFQARGLLLALRTGERSRVARALFLETAFVASAGPKTASRSRALLDEATRVASPLGDAYLEGWRHIGAGLIHYFNGRYRSAVEEVTGAEAIFRERGDSAWELSSVRMFRMWSLHRLGALAEMTPLLQGYLRDAERRGDRYAQTSLIRSCHRGLLVSGDVHQARRELENTRWVASEGRYHLQHWYEFYALAELALYAGESHQMADALLENMQGIKQSMLIRVQIVRVDLCWLRGRFLMDSSKANGLSRDALAEITGLIRKLEREGFGYADVIASLLRATVEMQQHGGERASERLRAVMKVAEEQDMILHAAVIERRLGELVGGDEGAETIARADARLRTQGVRDPAPMAQMIAPGFS